MAVFMCVSHVMFTSDVHFFPFSVELGVMGTKGMCSVYDIFKGCDNFFFNKKLSYEHWHTCCIVFICLCLNCQFLLDNFFFFFKSEIDELQS